MFRVGDKVMYNFRRCSEPRMYGECGTIISIREGQFSVGELLYFAKIAWDNPERIETYRWPRTGEPISLTNKVFELVSPREPDWRL